jgi:methyl-accepting chemotaxis protein
MLVRRAMLREIRGIADAVQDLAAGKLTAGAPKQGSDEIADTSRVLDQTIANLNQTLRTIMDAVQSIDTASREIASGNSTCRRARKCRPVRWKKHRAPWKP